MNCVRPVCHQYVSRVTVLLYGSVPTSMYSIGLRTVLYNHCTVAYVRRVDSVDIGQGPSTATGRVVF